MVDEPIEPGATVLVTGATGFVGRAVCARLNEAGYSVRAVGRHEVGEIHRGTDWRAVLEGCDAVVHLAARVHVMNGGADGDDEVYREVNLHGTATLVRQAREAGLRRFVFMSTIKVLGESGVEVKPDDPPAPHDAYAVSKTEAEAAIHDLAEEMDVVILRPPLVYGPGVRANFERLMRLVATGWPLPFSAIRNRRSLIHVGNLADAVRHALICRPGTYHPKDRRDLSLPELTQLIASGMERPCRMFPVPTVLLRLAGRLTGRHASVSRLTETFTSDGVMDGWVPPIATEDGIDKTAWSYLRRYAR